MSVKNDEKIMQLKERIAEKREAIKKSSKRFSPITNCMISLDGTTQNINVLDLEQLTMLLIKLNSLKISANDLCMDVPDISGYSIDSWMRDVKSRMDQIKVQQDKKELENAERQLDKLLSDDKKTELAISEIEKLLG